MGDMRHQKQSPYGAGRCLKGDQCKGGRPLAENRTKLELRVKREGGGGACHYRVHVTKGTEKKTSFV